MTPLNRSPLSDGLSQSKAAKKFYLRDRNTGAFLHLSGTGATKDTDYAWAGTLTQAACLQSRAAAKGADWPYAPVSGSILHRFIPECV